jgi:polyisoprenoid-binding protein YceI
MKRFPGLSLVLPPLVGVLLLAGCEDKPKFSAGVAPGGDSAELAGVAMVGSGAEIVLNSENTHITFVGSKPAGDKHNGGFKKVDGILKLDGQREKPQISDVSVNIDADSIFTDVGDRLTTHLKSKDFFSVKDNPRITFQSTTTATVPGQRGKVNVTGDLTLLGVTKPVSFVLTVESGKFPYISGEFEISRKEFGMNFKPGDINDKVSVKVEVGKSEKK